jgi:hypothetical protein
MLLELRAHVYTVLHAIVNATVNSRNNTFDLVLRAQCAVRLDASADHAILQLLLRLHDLLLTGVDPEDWRPLLRRPRRLQTAQDGAE